MWFRLELDTSGAILDCKEVDQPSCDGRLICYVEAPTRAAACSAAKLWHARKKLQDVACRKRRIEARREKGLCVGCGRVPADGECDSCQEKAAARRAIREASQGPRLTLTPWQARENKRLQSRVAALYMVNIRFISKKLAELEGEGFARWIAAEITRRDSLATELRSTAHEPSPSPVTGRPRTGSLVMTKTGWAARYTVTRAGASKRVQRQLDTSSRSLAEQRLKAILFQEASVAAVPQAAE